MVMGVQDCKGCARKDLWMICYLRKGQNRMQQSIESELEFEDCEPIMDSTMVDSNNQGAYGFATVTRGKRWYRSPVGCEMAPIGDELFTIMQSNP